MNPTMKRHKIFLGAVTIVGFLTVGSFKSGLAAEMVNRRYVVHGMHCEGCIGGVKFGLKNAGVLETDILKVELDEKAIAGGEKKGYASVRLEKSRYKGKETDCAIVRSIRAAGYEASWDEKQKDPCNFGPLE